MELTVSFKKEIAMNRAFTFLVGVLLLGWAASAWAAAPSVAYSRLQPLEWQVGDWVAEYQSTADSGAVKKGDMVKVRFSLRWSPDRTYYVNNSFFEVNGKKVATALEVISWDQEKSTVRHAYFGTWGTGQGTWRKLGDQGELEWAIQGPYGTFKGVAYIARDGDSWKWQIREQTRNGEPMADMPVATFSREKGLAPAGAGDAVPSAVVQNHFDFLAGDWKVEGTVDGKKFTSDTSFQRAPGKHALVCHWNGEFGGQPVHGTALLGWDAKAKQVVDFGFIRELGWRAMRYTPNAAGAWEGELEGVIRGEEVRATFKIEVTGKDTFVLTSAAGPNNPEQEYRYRRVTAAEKVKGADKRKEWNQQKDVVYGYKSERTNATPWAQANTGYRSFLWTSPAEAGREPVPYAGGAFHQMCYIDAARKFVVVKFSSFLGPRPGRPVEDEANQNDDVAIQSFLEQTLPELVR
jgi:hypothetical protein